MRKTISTSVIIDATEKDIWEKLTEFRRYHEWNPFIIEAKGKAIQHGILDITISPPNAKPQKFKPTIIDLNNNERLIWRGKYMSSRIFQGIHEFKIRRISDKSVILQHNEYFSGLLLPLLWPMIAKSTRTGFELMNAALKKVCEKK